MISGERTVEWLFIPLETCVPSSSFDMVGTQETKKTISLSCSRRRDKEKTRQDENKLKHGYKQR